MIRHVSLLTLDATAGAEQRQAIFDGLARLPTEVPGIAGYHYGADLGLADDNADIAIVADFADRDAYETYRDHPAHRAVLADLIKPVLASRVAAQYEVHDV